MAFLVFVVDLRTLSPQFLELIKNCLLEFANLFVFSSLEDRIALCYFVQSESSSDELKVAYCPEKTSFNLLDFHDAVNGLPSDSYSPHLLERSTLPKAGNLALILNDQMLIPARRKETERKVILIGACLDSKVDLTAILPDIDGRDISVQSVILKNYDIDNLSDAYLQEELMMNGKAKKWIEELKNNIGLWAHFQFQFQRSNNSSISCRLFSSSNQIQNEFFLCEEHGYHHMLKSKNSVEDTLLEEESRNCQKLSKAGFGATFYVIGRTRLLSLDKGLVIGRPYWVIPRDSSHVIAFRTLLWALTKRYEGLICRGECNLDTMNSMESTMRYFYLLEPSDGGRMVLKRLAGAEETIPCPEFPKYPPRLIEDVLGILDDNSILDEVDSLKYEGKLGLFHTNLNLLIKDRKRGHGSDGGGLIHVDEIQRTKLT